MLRNIVFAVLFLNLLPVTVMATGNMPVAPPMPRASEQVVVSPSVTAPLPISDSKEYVLGVGDKVRMTVFGEKDLSGDYDVNSSGLISLPLVGTVQAGNLTLPQFEEKVRNSLKGTYLKDPRVTVEVVNYRPFFIIGEVSKPGSYPYVNGMTVLNAVALAGGFTYRADEGDIRILHTGDPNKKELEAEKNDIVMPGDIVRVTQRLF